MPSAKPSASNPGPRFALDAGTRTFIHLKGGLASDTQHYPRSLTGRPVNRPHQFQRLISFFTRDQRLATLANRFAEIEKLPLEWNQRNRHRIRRARLHIALNRRIVIRFAFHIPRRQFVARNNRCALGAVNLHSLRISRPERRRSLDHSSRAIFIPHYRRDDILALDLMQRAELPLAINSLHAPDQPQQNIHLMHRLIDQRTAAFHLPATFDGPRIIFRRPEPFHIRIGLKNFSEPVFADRAFQETAGIVKAMLAHHAQQNTAPRGRHHHRFRSVQICRDGLLHLHVLLRDSAQLNRLQPKIRKRANIHEIDMRMTAHVLPRRHRLASVLRAKLLRPPRRHIARRRDLISDIGIRLRVLMRYRTRTDHPHPQGLAYAHSSSSVTPQIATSIPNSSHAAALAAKAFFADASSGAYATWM